jgi:hypothetical protein
VMRGARARAAGLLGCWAAGLLGCWAHGPGGEGRGSMAGVAAVHRHWLARVRGRRTKLLLLFQLLQAGSSGARGAF